MRKHAVPAPNASQNITLAQDMRTRLRKMEIDMDTKYGVTVSVSFIIDHLLRNMDPKAVMAEMARGAK